MKQQIKKWSLRLILTGLLIAGLLLTIILNPILAYANKTIQNNFIIYHNNRTNDLLNSQLEQAKTLLETSELYNSNLKLDICLNDGSNYPAIIKAIRGRAFAWGFYNKVVLQGTMNCKENFVELNGYKWNLTQLFAHEMTHCLQFDKLGFWKSKPVADIPDWKWEGYAEYVSRQNNDQKDLSKNIVRLMATNKNNWEVYFADSTLAPKEYYNYWTLMQYCMDIKKMNYKQLLADTSSERTIRQQMMRWFNSQK